jgi:hypothetical protein
MANSVANVELQMQLAIAACSEPGDPSYSAIAAQLPPVNRQTLKRRFLGEQTSQALSNSMHL